MNYIELINSFWELDETWQFTCCETRLYFYLLKTANRLGWVDNWTHSVNKLAANVGVSENSVRAARNRLIQAGLISVIKGGSGQRDKSRHQILNPNLNPKPHPKPHPKLDPKANYTLLDKLKVNQTKPPTPFENFEINFNFDFCDEKWRELIKRWIEHRANQDKKPLVQYQVEQIYSSLSKFTFDEASQLIETSIFNGWGNLYLEKFVKSKQTKNDTNSRLFVAECDYGDSTI